MATPISVDCIYVNGCSWTYGSELRDPAHANIADDFSVEHDRYRQAHNWAALLGKHFDLEVFNGSEAGAGNDRILRTTTKDVAKLKQLGRKPLVIIAWSHIQRFELPDNPQGTQWRSFVGPSNSIKNPAVVDEIFGSWSTDRSDFIKWVQSMILLDGLLKSIHVPYFGTCVFDSNTRISDMFAQDKDLDPYYFALKFWVGQPRHAIRHSLDNYVKQFPEVTRGPGGHPLELGHEYISKWFISKLETNFIFNRPK